MNEPRYDEDYVNLGYLNKKTLEEYQKTNAEINKRSQNFGSQPNPPYYVNDTYMDGKDIYICTNSRVIGDFNALDWELASEYVTDGNMDARLLALNTAIGVVLDDLQEQLDGTVDIWTYEGEPTLLNEPAVNWDTPSELNKHVGDVYNDMLTGDSYRFVYYDDEYLWLRITDSQAAAAYTLAQQAKDTADGKMRVFISTPYTPYNVGDLWAQGSSGGLYRCKTAKLTGTFDAVDWEPAVNYDETATVIQNGLITTGSLIVKQGGSYTAGITGNTSGDSAIRFWAGSDFDNRVGAPFRITQGGKLTATGVDVTGKITATSGSFTGAVTATSGSFTGSINATSGTIGGWSIKSTYIDSTSGGGMFYLASNADTSNYYIQATGTDGVTRFSLGKNGVLTTTGANITGAITATSGTFNGSINATTITANSGTIGGFTLSSSGFSGSTTKGSMLLRRGSTASVDFPTNGGRLMLSSSASVPNVVLTSAGGAGGNGLCIADSYSSSGTGASNATIGIRALFGRLRLASNVAIDMAGSHVTMLGTANIGSYYFNGGHTFYGNGSTSIDHGAQFYAASNILLRPRTGYKAYVGSTASGNEIATVSGGFSSRNVKTNFNIITDYKKIYNELKNLNLYTFDYKYKGIKDYVADFGFIIDEIEKTTQLSKYTRHYVKNMVVTENNELVLDTKNINNGKKIKVKEWERDSYIKMMLVCIKSLQTKIEELEERINER